MRLRPVIQRSRELFWEPGADTLANEIETNSVASVQLSLFLDGPLVVRGRSQQRGRLSEAANANLDAPLQVITPYRAHAAMLYQASGRNAALHNLLRAEQGRGSDFRHLTPSLSSTPRSAKKSGCWDGTLLTAPR